MEQVNNAGNPRKCVDPRTLFINPINMKLAAKKLCRTKAETDMHETVLIYNTKEKQRF